MCTDWLNQNHHFSIKSKTKCAFSRDLALYLHQDPQLHKSHVWKFSIFCLTASFFSGVGPFNFTWCLSTSQDASDFQLPNLIRASFLHPAHRHPTLLLCDVVAQTVKVNHSGLYINIWEKKNTSVCLCRCTNLLSKQNHKTLTKKSTKVSESKWRRMCLDFFLVLNWIMDVLWFPELHSRATFLSPPPYEGAGALLCATLIGWEW